MPWSGKSFASRHNHALHGEKAAKAASIANAILKETGDEGKAIRIANARARADGGPADIQNAIRVAQRAVGGFTPPSPSYATRAAARNVDEAADHPYGFTAGTGLGRHDRNEITVGSGSYVLPSDIVAGLGDGNSLAGADIWNKILASMPYGITPPKLGGQRPPPTPPHDAYLAHGMNMSGQQQFADGGETEEEVPIVSADGEIVISPDDVYRIGLYYAPDREKERGDRKAIMRRAHRILDGFVKQVRGDTIRHLRGLRGPVGSKDASKGHS